MCSSRIPSLVAGAAAVGVTGVTVAVYGASPVGIAVHGPTTCQLPSASARFAAAGSNGSSGPVPVQ
ncbi:hypothetical protein A6A29_41010 [Streptomyces sp. TSRI0281]|nr:hypothetical protein A6A29_41010 [Streptomyces sp. TSRI0281]